MSDEGIREYHAPAGGWGALKAVARTLRSQMDIVAGSQTLMRNNQPHGFDCPGCAWPDPKHTSAFEFCENGAKAVPGRRQKSAPHPKCWRNTACATCSPGTITISRTWAGSPTR